MARSQTTSKRAPRQSRIDALYGVPSEQLNPDIRFVGPGPEGERCGSCASLRATHVPTSSDANHVRDRQTLYYCGLTGAAKRVTWPACARFAAAPLPSPAAGGSTV